MVEVRFLSWESGFKKIGFNKLIQKTLGIGLAEAKSIVDDVSHGVDGSVYVEDPSIAEKLCKEARMLGVISEIQSR